MENVFKLRTNRSYKDSKIEISYSVGSIDRMLSVYMFDKDGVRHHVLWDIRPNSSQCFSKINKKVELFVSDKINTWFEEQSLEDYNRENREHIRREEYSKKIKELMNNF